jgi:serine/threonine-protein kinase HipA
MAKELIVLVNGDHLGHIAQSTNGRLAFEYDNRWLARIDAYPLSLSMPLTAKRHTHATIANYLLGLLPDRDRALDAIAKRHGVSRNPFALAGAIGEDLAGAVQIVPPGRLATLKRREGANPISEERLAKFLDQLVANPGAMQITEDAGLFSLAGAQPKKAISWVNGKWREPRGRTPSTHIIKPPMVHLAGQVENEHFCLRLAQACELTAVRSEVVMIGGKPNIVTERYDRRRFRGGRTLPLTSAGGTVVRLHQEDMCQALGITPADKYQSEGGPGMKAIMNLLGGSGNPSADRTRFMRACAFNFAILGTDAHAKNYSVLIEPGNYRLAPLYDINSVLPYDTLDTRKLAMSIGGEFRWRQIHRRNWEKAAETCGYPTEEALGQLRDILRRAPDHAQDILRRFHEDGLGSPTLSRLAAGLTRRCADVRKLYGL